MFRKAMWATDGSEAADRHCRLRRYDVDRGGELLVAYREELTMSVKGGSFAGSRRTRRTESQDRASGRRALRRWDSFAHAQLRRRRSQLPAFRSWGSRRRRTCDRGRRPGGRSRTRRAATAPVLAPPPGATTAADPPSCYWLKVGLSRSATAEELPDAAGIHELRIPDPSIGRLRPSPSFGCPLPGTDQRSARDARLEGNSQAT
jgi:hypothetical protein